MPTCIFCRIVVGDAPCYRVAETGSALAFLDIQPAAEGHLLVIPKGHYENVFDIDPGAMAAVADLVRRLAPVLRDVVRPGGLIVTQANGLAAGQSVMHFHTHLIPRTGGQRLRMHGAEMADPERLEALARAICTRVIGGRLTS